MSATGPQQLKVLMLHGFTQSGSLFHAKTRALEKHLEKAFPAAPSPGHLPTYPGGIKLYYPTAPIRLTGAEIPGFDVNAADGDATEAYAWWVRKGDTEPFTYDRMEEGLACVAGVLQKEGPFDGVVGFSQGGALAGIVAALLESGRREAFEKRRAQGGMAFPDEFMTSTGYMEEVVHPPLKFAVSYSGFGATTNPLYTPFYEPKIETPMLHFLGSVDTVVEEARSLRLVDSCVNGRGVDGGVARVVYHPGGHFVPASQKQYVGALIAFIREVCGGASKQQGTETSGQNESVEDMDVPF